MRRSGVVVLPSLARITVRIYAAIRFAQTQTIGCVCREQPHYRTTIAMPAELRRAAAVALLIFHLIDAADAASAIAATTCAYAHELASTTPTATRVASEPLCEPAMKPQERATRVATKRRVKEGVHARVDASRHHGDNMTWQVESAYTADTTRQFHVAVVDASVN